MSREPGRGHAVGATGEDRAVLEELRIQGLGVIDDALLPLSSGLTVLTGETGAGKTMVVQGLALLFGGRADTGRVRPESGRALVEGRLVLPGEHPAVVRCLDAGGELDEGTLLLSRSVGADGRSRAHIGGRAVPVGVLAEVGEDVLALHGQNDQQRLLQPARQRAALDRFAGEEALALRDAFGAQWARLRDVRATVEQLSEEGESRRREAELLRIGLAELEALAAQPGEQALLEVEIERLAHADALGSAAGTSRQLLTGEEAGDGGDVLQLVVGVQRLLDAVAEHDPALGELAGRAREIGVLVVDLAQDLASYAAGVEDDPARLQSAQTRLSALTAAVRRLGTDDVESLLAWASRAGQRLLELDGTDDQIGVLRAEEQALATTLADVGGRLTRAREAAAERFSAAVTAELVQLAMPHAEVVAAVSQRESPDGLLVQGRVLAAGPEGLDDVELLLVPHRGAPARPLGKGASGGELSRVMLAVEVVFAGSDPVPVMVFDEVDAGVGGAAAVEIGRRLARLAADHQVLVVTHLPQVAAFADCHLRVVKTDEGDAVTRGGVEVLDDEARVVELSRMLAGLDSGLARAHAEELLAQSRASSARDSAR
ncbi:MAG TPA: DNA repair protein RecN [Mycobacteriales bacterium]|nr:DNA repair protein RecN [Mycobacteriales bacterium]